MFMRFHWSDSFKVLKALREFAEEARQRGVNAAKWDRKADEYEQKNILGKVR